MQYPSPVWVTDERGTIVRVRAKEAKEGTGAHTVAIAAFDGLSMFEFAMASEVFGPQDVVGPDWYRTAVCSAGAKPVTLDTGLRMDVPDNLEILMAADTVVVPPCDDPHGVLPEVLQAIQQAHERGARVMSLCTGAFVLAAAGLLTGRRVTTHWGECERLAREYPDLDVDPDVLYVDDGDVLTSAGSAASLDLCLHIVRKDHGADVAARLARDLVVPPHRDGGQAQYISTPLPDPASSDLFVDTMSWVQGHLGEAITVNDLARRSAMSRRTFARRFLETTGATPYQWLLHQRLQLAQQLLETTDLPIEAVAQRSGFVNAGNLRRHFSRHVMTSPNSYRRTFRTPE
ncbi:MAG: AraC family transcriptional regulator [Mycobacterium sp.]|nr:AraC family transcriptional regulator [Mycobacterium sp.]